MFEIKKVYMAKVTEEFKKTIMISSEGTPSWQLVTTKFVFLVVKFLLPMASKYAQKKIIKINFYKLI